MTELAALLFDVDGTLADTERDGHRVAFNRAFADAGLDWEWSVPVYGELLSVAGGKERIRHYIDRYHPDFEPPEPLAEFVAGLHEAKTRHYTALVKAGALPLRPGVKRLIMEARSDGLRLAIATTTSPANVEALLEHSLGEGSKHWFDVIACSDVAPVKKPEPDVYLYVLDQMGLNPSQCMAFEDSENGVKAARAAQLPTLVSVNDYTREHDFTGAVLVVDQLGEPNQPFRVLAGDAGGARYVDLSLVRWLHAQAAGRARDSA